MVDRADIAQAMMAQLPGGWATQGNNVFDPTGALVGQHGLQQYGQIPGGYQPTSSAGNQYSVMPPVGSSLSGGMAPGTGSVTTTNEGAWGSGGNLADLNPASSSLGSGRSVGNMPSSGNLFEGAPDFGFHAGSFSFDPSAPAPSPPTGQPPDPNDFSPSMNDRNASLVTPAGGWPSGNSFQAGPNPNSPADQAAMSAMSSGGDFAGFGGFSGGSGGGWGGGGFAGSGFSSSGGYSGGYDTAAGSVG